MYQVRFHIDVLSIAMSAKERSDTLQAALATVLPGGGTGHMLRCRQRRWLAARGVPGRFERKRGGQWRRQRGIGGAGGNPGGYGRKGPSRACRKANPDALYWKGRPAPCSLARSAMSRSPSWLSRKPIWRKCSSPRKKPAPKSKKRFPSHNRLSSLAKAASSYAIKSSVIA